MFSLLPGSIELVENMSKYMSSCQMFVYNYFYVAGKIGLISSDIYAV